MRKSLVMILIIVLALSLCACGNKAKEQETATTATETPSMEETSSEEASTNGTNISEVTSTDELETPNIESLEEVTTAPHKHEYYSEITKEATCTANGERKYTCSCDDTYTEPIPAVGHSFSKYEYNGDATVNKDGTKTAVCATCGTKDTKTAEGSKIAFTYKDMNAIMYATSSVNIRKYPTSDSEKLGSLNKAAEVKVTGQCKENNWYRIEYDGNEAYVSDKYLSKDKPYVPDALPEKYKNVGDSGPYKVVNGIPYTVHEGGEYDYKYNGLSEALCKAGYNKPIYYEPFDAYFMLYDCPYNILTDEGWKVQIEAWKKLEEYLLSMGISQEKFDDAYSSITEGVINGCGDRYVRIDL